MKRILKFGGALLALGMLLASCNMVTSDSTVSGNSIWIECKRPVGGRLSDGQRRFLDAMNRNGAVGIVVNSIESLEAQLREAGVI